MITLRPVPEDLAEGKVRVIYEDIRSTLGFPRVGQVFQAYAEYPPLLDLAWQDLKPNLLTEQLSLDAARLRWEAQDAVTRTLFMPDHVASLVRLALSEHTPTIVRTVVAFDRHLPLLQLTAQAVHRAITDGRVGSSGKARPLAPPLESYDVPLELVDEAAADGKLRSLFDEIRSSLGQPEVSSLFLALARWPDYLEYCWTKLKPTLLGRKFRELSSELAEMGRTLTSSLPRGMGALSSRGLREAGLSEAEVARCQAIAGYYADAMPGQVLTAAAIKTGLGVPPEPPG